MVPLLGNLKAMQDMSKKSLETEYLSPFRGSMRRTWREGSCTEGSEILVMEGSGNGAFLL